MAVGLFTDPVFFTIGSSSFLHCFFSTIACRLENNLWGSRFPILMNRLYNEGEIQPTDCRTASEELSVIKRELLNFSPDKVIWDFDDLSRQPPWGDRIAERITSLANYFWTGDGEDLFEVFEKALNASINIQEPLVIRSL